MEELKIANRKISDRVAEKIEGWILSGKFQPGEKLPSVRELCDMFAVGRTAIRDAITSLKGKGMVEVKHGEGTFVCLFDTSRLFDERIFMNASDIQKVYKVRKLLEAGIAEMAAENREPVHLDKMREALNHLRSAETLKAWEADYHFHLAIAEATENEILVELITTISSAMQKVMANFHQILVEDQHLRETMVKQHESIYQAIERREAVQARESMMEHLGYVEALFLGV